MAKSVIKRQLLFFLIVFLAIATLSFSASALNFIESLAKPFAGADFAATYNNPSYTPFIDFVLVLIFFIGITKVGLGKLDVFKAKGGSLAMTTFAIMLSLGFVTWERKAGFNLGNLGPFAAMLFSLMIAVFIYKLLKGFGFSTGAAFGGFPFAFAYLTIATLMPELMSVIQEKVPFVWGLANILFLISIFAGFKGLFDKFKSVGSSTGPGLAPGSGTSLPPGFEGRIQNLEAQNTNLLTDIKNIISKLEELDEELKKEDKHIIYDIDSLESKVSVVQNFINKYKSGLPTDPAQKKAAEKEYENIKIIMQNLQRSFKKHIQEDKIVLGLLNDYLDYFNKIYKKIGKRYMELKRAYKKHIMGGSIPEIENILNDWRSESKKIIGIIRTRMDKESKLGYLENEFKKVSSDLNNFVKNPNILNWLNELKDFFVNDFKSTQEILRTFDYIKKLENILKKHGVSFPSPSP